MDNRRAVLLGLSCALLLTGLAGCGDGGSSSAGAGIRQTRFPGEVTAGGGTSGEVLARAGGGTNAKNSSGTPGIPEGKGGNTGGAAVPGQSASANVKGSGEEGMRGQAATPGGSVSGTPGIPEGAGGTSSGAAMGGTTPAAAGSKAVPEPKQAPAAPAQK